jgi:UBX domain-containing protein 1/4
MEWLLSHADEPEPMEEPVESKIEREEDKSTQQEENSQQQQQQAHSLKCDECGKLLRDADAATTHAIKTKHESFSESIESIKPKTPEEIEEEKKRLQEKLIRLRKEREEKEKQAEIEREIARRKQGRQIVEIRQKVQEQEMIRIAEEKRREKRQLEEQKQKIKEQIARDREAMKKSQEPKEASSSSSIDTLSSKEKLTNQQIVPQRSYDECKIQVRLTDGKVMQHTFKAKEQLAAVRLWIELNRTDDKGNFNILQPFPRKQYTEEEMLMTLEMLKLVPATSLIITRV